MWDIDFSVFLATILHESNQWFLQFETQIDFDFKQWFSTCLNTDFSLIVPTIYINKLLVPNAMQTATKQTPSACTQAACTCTCLCIARLSCLAFTVFAAICRWRFGASSALSTAATSHRARTKTRPSTVQYTIPCNTVCKVTHDTGEQPFSLSDRVNPQIEWTVFVHRNW